MQDAAAAPSLASAAALPPQMSSAQGGGVLNDMLAALLDGTRVFSQRGGPMDTVQVQAWMARLQAALQQHPEYAENVRSLCVPPSEATTTAEAMHNHVEQGTMLRRYLVLRTYAAATLMGGLWSALHPEELLRALDQGLVPDKVETRRGTETDCCAIDAAQVRQACHFFMAQGADAGGLWFPWETNAAALDVLYHPRLGMGASRLADGATTQMHMYAMTRLALAVVTTCTRRLDGTDGGGLRYPAFFRVDDTKTATRVTPLGDMLTLLGPLVMRQLRIVTVAIWGLVNHLGMNNVSPQLQKTHTMARKAYWHLAEHHYGHMQQAVLDSMQRCTDGEPKMLPMMLDWCLRETLTASPAGFPHVPFVAASLLLGVPLQDVPSVLQAGEGAGFASANLAHQLAPCPVFTAWLQRALCPAAVSLVVGSCLYVVLDVVMCLFAHHFDAQARLPLHVMTVYTPESVKTVQRDADLRYEVDLAYLQAMLQRCRQGPLPTPCATRVTALAPVFAELWPRTNAPPNLLLWSPALPVTGVPGTPCPVTPQAGMTANVSANWSAFLDQVAATAGAPARDGTVADLAACRREFDQLALPPLAAETQPSVPATVALHDVRDDFTWLRTVDLSTWDCT